MKSVTRLGPIVALCFVFSTLAFAQQKTASNAAQKFNDQIPSRSRTANATPRQPFSFGLLEDTPVRMTLRWMAFVVISGLGYVTHYFSTLFALACAC